MDAAEKPIVMVREHLEEIPKFALPPGYSWRWFQHGDEELWFKIQLAADRLSKITPELFREKFGTDEKLLAQRQCFIFDEVGNATGTATAWFDENFLGQNFGRVHWVAVVPEHQGRGLGKALMTVTCCRLEELGHERAYLRTSTARGQAIQLYRRFGFVPLIRNPEDERNWREVLAGRR